MQTQTPKEPNKLALAIDNHVHINHIYIYFTKHPIDSCEQRMQDPENGSYACVTPIFRKMRRLGRGKSPAEILPRPKTEASYSYSRLERRPGLWHAGQTSASQHTSIRLLVPRCLRSRVPPSWCCAYCTPHARPQQPQRQP